MCNDATDSDETPDLNGIITVSSLDKVLRLLGKSASGMDKKRGERSPIPNPKITSPADNCYTPANGPLPLRLSSNVPQYQHTLAITDVGGLPTAQQPVPIPANTSYPTSALVYIPADPPTGPTFYLITFSVIVGGRVYANAIVVNTDPTKTPC